MAHGAVSRWLGSYWPEEDDEDEDIPTCTRCGLHLLVSELMETAPICGPCQQHEPDPTQEPLDF